MSANYATTLARRVAGRRGPKVAVWDVAAGTQADPHYSMARKTLAARNDERRLCTGSAQASSRERCVGKIRCSSAPACRLAGAPPIIQPLSGIALKGRHRLHADRPSVPARDQASAEGVSRSPRRGLKGCNRVSFNPRSAVLPPCGLGLGAAGRVQGDVTIILRAGSSQFAVTQNRMGCRIIFRPTIGPACR